MDRIDVLNAVSERLSQVERDRGIRILHAVESGSRAWGFGSMDSDYDIRFVYAHERDWYLSAVIEEKPDCVGAMEESGIGTIDMVGWDVRKALRLFRSANPQLAEWLFSPVVYVDNSVFSSLLRKSVGCMSPGGLWQHYFGLAKSARKSFVEAGHTAKRLLYFLRALLAMQYLETYAAELPMRKHKLPPVLFERLVEETVTDCDFRKAIHDLVDMKKFGYETDGMNPTDNVVIEFAMNEWDMRKSRKPGLPYERERFNIDKVFREILDEEFRGIDS